MGKVLLSFAVFLSSLSAIAAGQIYDLQMEISRDGKKISSFRVTAIDGQLAQVVEETATEKTFVEVLATEQKNGPRPGIQMSFTIGSIAKDGTRTVISKPQILARENAPAQITVGDQDGKNALSLSVTARRNKL